MRRHQLRSLEERGPVAARARARSALEAHSEDTLQDVAEHARVRLRAMRHLALAGADAEVLRQRLELERPHRVLVQSLARQRKRVHEAPIVREFAPESAILRLQKPGVELPRVVRGEAFKRAAVFPRLHPNSSKSSAARANEGTAGADTIAFVIPVSATTGGMLNRPDSPASPMPALPRFSAVVAR